jgi:hypothetical protein
MESKKYKKITNEEKEIEKESKKKIINKLN